MSVSTRPGCAWEGLICVDRLASVISALGADQEKTKFPEVSIHVLATSLPLQVAWTSIRVLCRKAVEWVQAGHDPLTFPQGSGPIVWDDQVGQAGLLGLLVWDTVIQHSTGRMWPLLQSHLFRLCQSVYSISIRRSTLQVQVGVASCPH